MARKSVCGVNAGSADSFSLRSVSRLGRQAPTRHAACTIARSACAASTESGTARDSRPAKVPGRNGIHEGLLQAADLRGACRPSEMEFDEQPAPGCATTVTRLCHLGFGSKAREAVVSRTNSTLRGGQVLLTSEDGGLKLAENEAHPRRRPMTGPDCEATGCGLLFQRYYTSASPGRARVRASIR